MRDLTIRLEHRPGALADMGEALGRADVSIEGGGAFALGDQGVAHFLVEDSPRARAALQAAGIEVLADREVLNVQLDQEMPGQLGAIARRIGDAGINIEVVYSDHRNQLVLCVDDPASGRAVCETWTRGRHSPSPAREHRYHTTVRWTGNTGAGTVSYRGYKRDYEIAATGKPVIPGSSDPHFHGNGARWNPEDLLVASLSACHELWYLHLCADAGVVVKAYEDDAEGCMTERADGSGSFDRVVLRPRVTITKESDAALAMTLHEHAHEKCFIARSVNFPVTTEATITHAP